MVLDHPCSIKQRHCRLFLTVPPAWMGMLYVLLFVYSAGSCGAVPAALILSSAHNDVHTHHPCAATILMNASSPLTDITPSALAPDAPFEVPLQHNLADTRHASHTLFIFFVLLIPRGIAFSTHVQSVIAVSPSSTTASVDVPPPRCCTTA